MTKNDLFRLLGEAVKFSPEVTVSRTALRLNTFAVLRSPAEMNSDSLEKTVWDRDKPFFYSRKWEANNFTANRVNFDYPALIAYDLQPRLTGFFKGKGKRLINIRLDCLYPNVAKADQNIKNACKELLVQEIYTATEAMIIQALSYLKNSIYATVDGTPGWHNQDRLDQQVTDGDVTTYTKDVNQTNIFLRDIQAQNETMGGGYVDDESKDALCGVHYNFILTESACEVQDSEFQTINCC